MGSESLIHSEPYLLCYVYPYSRLFTTYPALPLSSVIMLLILHISDNIHIIDLILLSSNPTSSVIS